MVTDTGDIPAKSEVEPSGGDLVEDVLDSGEVVVVLRDGSEHELHGHDTYVFDDTVYTKNNDDDVWIVKDEITHVIRHYD